MAHRHYCRHCIALALSCSLPIAALRAPTPRVQCHACACPRALRRGLCKGMASTAAAQAVECFFLDMLQEPEPPDEAVTTYLCEVLLQADDSEADPQQGAACDADDMAEWQDSVAAMLMGVSPRFAALPDTQQLELLVALATQARAHAQQESHPLESALVRASCRCSGTTYATCTAVPAGAPRKRPKRRGPSATTINQRLHCGARRRGQR